MIKYYMNALVDGEVRVVTMSLENFERIKHAAIRGRLIASQKMKARKFRYSKMMYKTRSW